MSTTVILCEKPDMAINIAKALGEYEKKSGYLQTKEYVITWAFGHIVQLAPPNVYIDKERIGLEDLPIIPSQFRLKVIEDKENQYHTIRTLFLKADNLINAADAGREGELIFRYIYEKTGCQKPFKRLWLKSLTKKGILQGFENLLPGEEKETLYLSAKARSQADWLVGLNSSIAFSHRANIGRFLSLGRVQTPTLKMIVERFLEVKNFTKKAVFSPFIEINSEVDGFGPTRMIYCKNFDKKPEDDFLEQIKEKVYCIASEEKDRIEKAPLPFDLPSLQQKASQLYKYSAKETGTIMQSLYEKHKVLTYPRTDSRYITKDVYEEIPEILETLKDYSSLSIHIKSLIGKELPKGCVNDNKVTDHHAIIPTGIIPSNLSDKEKHIFELVFSQFIASFFPKCLKSITTYALAKHPEITLESEDFFYIKGTVIREKGWRKVLDEEIKDELLPKLEQGKSYPLTDKGILKSFTRPKSLYTDGTLIAAMTGAGKEFDSNYDIPIDVKNNGIGRQGTRAQIIESLLSRMYVTREKNYLIPTAFGMETINALENSILSSVQLTGKWENSLEKIVNKDLEYETFMNNVNELTKELTEQVSKISIVFSEDKYLCPKCKNKTMVNRRNFFDCQTESCDFRLWKKIAAKVIPDSILIELLNKGITPVIKGFKSSKTDTTFEASIKLTEDKLSFVFPKNELLSKTYKCPKCKKGSIKENSKSVFCSDYKEGCDFSIWKKTFGKKLSEKHIDLLMLGKETPLIKGFVSKNKKKFNASLKLDKEFKVELIFSKK